MTWGNQQLDRLLASQAFSLWVSATDAEAMDYLSKTDEDYGFPEGQGKSVITYTRSGEVVGARVGGRIQMASRQVSESLGPSGIICFSASTVSS